VVDSITQVFDGTGAYGTSSSSGSFGFGSGSATEGSYPTPTTTFMSATTTFMPTPQGPIGTMVAGDFNLTHEALIPADLPVIFAADMPADGASGFLQYMADVAGLDLGQLDTSGGVTAALARDSDPNFTLSLTVLDLTNESSAVLAGRFAESGGELLVPNDFGETILAVLDANRLIILSGVDVSPDVLRSTVDSLR